ncbi:MAG: aldo/keto reductase [Acidiferrobacterales bacterium]
MADRDVDLGGLLLDAEQQAAVCGLHGTGRVPGVTVEKSGLMVRSIPRTGEPLPVVGLGTWRTFDVGTDPARRADPGAVLRLCAQGGARVVDSSPMYGSAESVVGDLAQELGLGGHLFLATKVWVQGRDEGVRQMEESLKRLQVTCLDLMQVHNLVDWTIHLKTLRAWKEQGRVRYIGVTHYSESAYPALERALKTGEVDFLQVNYSIMSTEAERSLLPLAQELGVAVLVNRPFEEGDLFARLCGRPLPSWTAAFDCTSWAQFMLKFVLSHPAVTCVIPATSKPGHARDNLQAGHGGLPDPARRVQMARILSGM